MAVVNRRRKRVRRGRRRRRIYRSVGRTAMQALRVANMVRGLVNAEHHHYDINKLGASAISITDSKTAATQQFNFCQPAQGDGVGNRHGDSLKLTGLFVRANLEWNTSGDPVQYVRFIIYVDKCGRIVYPLDDAVPILEDNTDGSTCVWSPYKWEGRNEYVVLYDRTYALSSQVPSIQIAKHVKIPERYKHIHFQPAGLTVRENGLKGVIIGTQSVGTYPTLEMFTRTYYMDN